METDTCPDNMSVIKPAIHVTLTNGTAMASLSSKHQEQHGVCCACFSSPLLILLVGILFKVLFLLFFLFRVCRLADLFI